MWRGEGVVVSVSVVDEEVFVYEEVLVVGGMDMDVVGSNGSGVKTEAIVAVKADEEILMLKLMVKRDQKVRRSHLSTHISMTLPEGRSKPCSKKDVAGFCA